MFNIRSIRDASRLCVASAMVLAVSVGAASAATLSLSGGSAGTETLPSNWNPTVTDVGVATQLFNDGIINGSGTGIANITIYDPTHPGGLLSSPQNVLLNFQFIGSEAGFDNQSWLVQAGNTLLFQNSTANSGQNSGFFVINTGPSGFLPFFFRSNSVVGDDAHNGGPIGPNMQIAFAQAGNNANIFYAFFDDGGGSPIDADFDDVILRITVLDRPNEGGTAPLPAALPLFASGLAGLGLFRWRRKRKTASAMA